MGELHPSPTARYGNCPSDAVTKGINADNNPPSANKFVWCKQCGFRCNLDRDAKGINEFAGETITSGTDLSNGSFEDWTGGNPDDWTLTGTVTQETSSGYFDDSDDGTSSAKVTRSGSDISLSQVMATPSDFNSNIVAFRVRVKSSTSEIIRLRMTVNSTDYYSSYNSAQQNFQELYILVKCPATVSSLTVYILADNANGIAYIDQAILARSGNPTTVAVSAGCPHCGSYDYF
jgi:hypothetical protein